LQFSLFFFLFFSEVLNFLWNPIMCIESISQSDRKNWGFWKKVGFFDKMCMEKLDETIAKKHSYFCLSFNKPIWEKLISARSYKIKFSASKKINVELDSNRQNLVAFLLFKSILYAGKSLENEIKIKLSNLDLDFNTRWITSSDRQTTFYQILFFITVQRHCW